MEKIIRKGSIVKYKEVIDGLLAKGRRVVLKMTEGEVYRIDKGSDIYSVKIGDGESLNIDEIHVDDIEGVTYE